jgi:hypothetical protein
MSSKVFYLANHHLPRVPINRVPLDDRQLLERRMFNQLRLLNMMELVNYPASAILKQLDHYQQMEIEYFK